MSTFRFLLCPAIIILFSTPLFLFSQHNIEIAFPSLIFDTPVDIQNAADNSNRLFIVEQEGRIKVFENDPASSEATLFLDISDRVLSDSRYGLLGLAFHPNYSENGYFYLNYTAAGPNRSVISRFQVSETDENLADPESESVFLEVDQPHNFHNGGGVVFGPDGYLYISLGDGGPWNGQPDPDGNGQNTQTLLGSMVRIDVDQSDDGLNYAIPPDNPFAGNSDGSREEIWAFGLRNTWRFSFHPESGECWGGDNGENLWEEINIIENGGNYGWKIQEGNHCFDPPQNCNAAGLTPPIYEYDGLSTPRRSVIGGYTYTGSEKPGLSGKYIFGDFVRGQIWSLEYDGISPTVRTTLTTVAPNLSTFGLDEAGEIYWANWITGRIYHFVPENTSLNSDAPTLAGTFELLQNRPNPFNPFTAISYRLSIAGQVTLRIYDARGRLVRSLENNIYRSAGQYDYLWDGLDDARKPTASGIYFYRLTFQAADRIARSLTRKMLFMR